MIDCICLYAVKQFNFLSPARFAFDNGVLMTHSHLHTRTSSARVYDNMVAMTWFHGRFTGWQSKVVILSRKISIQTSSEENI